MRSDLSIEVPRNGHYQGGWLLRCIAENESGGVSYPPIDLTGHSLDLEVRSVAGQGSAIAKADIDIYDPANGRFTVTLNGRDFRAVPGATERVRLAYDLKHTYPDGITRIYPRGQVILVPGVS